jgi:transposase
MTVASGRCRAVRLLHFAAALHGPVVLVWDNPRTHVSRAMRQLIAAGPLTLYQLPVYAPELNLVEVIWSSNERSRANLAEQNID